MSKPYAGRLIFDHLPKTAGISIQNWLVETLGSGAVTPTLIIGHRAAIRQYGGEFSVLSGHIHFQDALGLDPRYQYITCLREPVERALSWLYFMKNNHDGQEFALKAEVTKFIEREGDYQSTDVIKSISNIYIQHFCSIGGVNFAADRAHVDKALQAISEYTVIGFFDRLPEFISRTASLIGVAEPDKIDRMNATRFKPELGGVPAALVERLEAINAADVEFYRAARHHCDAGTVSLVQPSAPAQGFSVKYERPSPRVVSTDSVKVTSISIRERSTVFRGSTILFDLEVHVSEPIHALVFGLHIFDSQGDWAYGTNNKLLGIRFDPLRRGKYRLTYNVLVDLPIGNYRAGFSLVDEVVGEFRTLAWYEIACSFQVVPDGSGTYVGYMPLHSTITLAPEGSGDVGACAPSHVGSMRVFSPVDRLAVGESFNFEVEIVNDSQIRWVGDEFRPLNLSYHWFTELGDIVEFDCPRTPLLVGGISPGARVPATISVRAPERSGMHRLILTLVHENVCWFETAGFEPGRLDIELVAV